MNPQYIDFLNFPQQNNNDYQIQDNNINNNQQFDFAEQNENFNNFIYDPNFIQQEDEFEQISEFDATHIYEVDQIQQDQSMDNLIICITNYKEKTEKILLSLQIYNIQIYLAEKNEENLKFSVWRTYTDFEWLHNILEKHYPGYILPPLPDKNKQVKINGFNDNSEFIKYRQNSLELFLNKLYDNTGIQYCQELKIFLTLEENEFEIQKQNWLKANLKKQIPLRTEKVGFFYQLFNKKPNMEEIEQRPNDTEDNQFGFYQEIYQKQAKQTEYAYKQLKSLVKFKQQQFEIFQNAQNVLRSQIEDIDEKNKLTNQINTLDQFQKVYQQMIKQNVLNPLYDHIKHYEKGLEFIKIRKQYRDSVYQLCNQLDKSSDQKEIKLLNNLYQNQQYKACIFAKNFENNHEFFLENTQKYIRNTLKKLSEIQLIFSPEIKKIWNF